MDLELLPRSGIIVHDPDPVKYERADTFTWIRNSENSELDPDPE